VGNKSKKKESSKVDIQRWAIQEQTLWKLCMLIFVINEKPSERSLETIFPGKSPFWCILSDALHVIS